MYLVTYQEINPLFFLLHIVLLSPFIKKADYSRDLIIFITSFISLFKIVYVVKPDLKLFF